MLNKFTGLDGFVIFHLAVFCVEGSQQEHESGEALLTVNDFKFAIILEHDYGAEKIFFAVTVELVAIIVGEGKEPQVVPKCLTFLLTPGIGTLIIWDKKIGLLVAE